MMKKILAITTLMLLALGTQAKVRLPHLIGDNMVLQQQTEARLWGWAKPGKTIKVTTSWSNETATAKANKQGEWLVSVKTPKASYTPLSITFDDGEKVTISNVLSGEVWVCAGQSNMEMPVKGFWMCPVDNYNQVVIDAKKHPGIRSAKIPSVMSAKPLNDAQCEWRVCAPNTVGDFSATGYFFAQTMQEALDIPIGLIEANKGGSRVESWLTKENLEKYTNDPTDSVEICKKWAQWDYHRSLLWRNGTFNPILNFTVKGILYYQGCSNVGDPGDQYAQRLKLLVEQWRSQFKLGEIPFYFVQIAPYRYDDDNNAISGMEAGSAEVQKGAASIISMGDSFRRIIELVENVSGQIQGISADITGMAKNGEEIVGHVRTIDAASHSAAEESETVSAATEEQSASVQEIANASRNLAELAQKLKDSTTQFKL